MGEATLVLRFGSALFYAAASFLIVVVNKLVLTSYRFPDQALGLGQLIVTIVVLRTAKGIGYITFPDTSYDILRKTWPLPLLYFLNLVCGLGSTKRLNLPMFTVLRRFSILMTMVLEKYMLGNDRSILMKTTVYAMVVGALIAASDDLAFDAVGYILIFVNDLATALNGVYTMKKLQAKELGKHGILYYNSLFALLPTTLVAYYTGGLSEAMTFKSWTDPWFVLEFASSCMMGFILMYATVVCTQYNSALTTTVVGVLKNIVITYLGMFIGGDYIFGFTNFLGLNISALASVGYSYFEFKGSGRERKIQIEPDKGGSSTGLLAVVSSGDGLAQSGPK